MMCVKCTLHQHYFRIQLMQDTAMLCDKLGLCRFYKFIRFLYNVGVAVRDLTEDTQSGEYISLGEGVTAWIYRDKSANGVTTNGIAKHETSENGAEFETSGNGAEYETSGNGAAYETLGNGVEHEASGDGATNGVCHDKTTDKTDMKRTTVTSELNGTGYITPGVSRTSTEDTEGKKGDTVFVVLHGGGFVYGSPTSISHFSAHLSSEAHNDVIALQYPLAPENKYPSQLMYLVRALRMIRRDYSTVHVIGISAGANLALASSLVMRDLGDSALPDSLTLIGGPYSLNTNSRSYEEYGDGPKITKSMLGQYWSLYMRGDMTLCGQLGQHEMSGEVVHSLEDLVLTDAETSVYVTPLEAQSLSGLPRILINVAEHDILKSDSVMLYRKLKNEKCDVKIKIFPGPHIHLAGDSGWAKEIIVRQIQVWHSNTV